MKLPLGRNSSVNLALHLAGHDHVQQHLTGVEAPGVHFVTTGAGSKIVPGRCGPLGWHACRQQV